MTTNSLHTSFRGLGLLSLVALLASIAGCGGGPVAAPTSYATYSTKDGGFTCEYPEGWVAHGGGKMNHWAKFKNGKAQVSMKTDLTGSLMGDMAASAGGGGFGGGAVIATPENMPVNKVHLGGKEDIAAEYSDYKEQEPESFNVPLGGEGRKSEFTASGGFSGKLRGYRATFLSRDRRFQVICTCSEGDWENLKPAFDRVLESFQSAG